MDRDVMRLLAHVDQTREEMRSIVRGMPSEQKAMLIKTCAAGSLCGFDEKDRLLSALWSTDWNKTKAAQKLHWSRMTLYRKLTKYKLEGGPRPGS